MVDILDFADTNNLFLVITYYHNQKRIFSVAFEHFEIKDGDLILTFKTGTAETPNKAIAKYAKLISGKIGVYYYTPISIKEIQIPDLVYGITDGKKI